MIIIDSIIKNITPIILETPKMRVLLSTFKIGRHPARNELVERFHSHLYYLPLNLNQRFHYGSYK